MTDIGDERAAAVAMAAVQRPNVLDVQGLRVAFSSRAGETEALRGVSFGVRSGETLAILGESGSGKTLSAFAVMGLLPPGAHVVSGSAAFHGSDLLRMSEAERRAVRGEKVAMVFQDALTALNPLWPVGWQIAEMLRTRRSASRAEARARAVELMDRVGIPRAAERFQQYPHEFSGGMRQRVVIAIALSLDPEVLIADEPTTALDVTVEAQILELLRDLQSETGMGIVLITHDLGVAAQTAHRIAVMYAGRVVETADVDEFFRGPEHPYSRALMRSIPPREGKTASLLPVRGSPPSIGDIPPGCAFHPRCDHATDRCREEFPPVVALASGRAAECHYAGELDA